MLRKHTAHVPLGSSLLFLLLISLASLVAPAHASASPDLTVENVWLENSSQPGQPVSMILPGEQFAIVVTVKNIGDATATGFYLDAYYDSDYGRGGPDDIAAGEVQEWYVGPLTAESGTHTTTWVVDPDNKIPELNELNNQKEYSFPESSVTTTTTTSSAQTAVEHTVSVYTRSRDGSLMAGVQVTLGAETKPSDSAGKTDFMVSAGTYSLAVQSPVSGGSGIQYVFSQWADGDTQNPRTITLAAPVTYDATYRTQYQLTMQAAPSNGGTTDPPVGTHWYDSGQSVTIQAFPASGYTFSSWSGSGSSGYTGSVNAALLTMSSPVTETANFFPASPVTITAVSMLPDPSQVIQGSAISFFVTLRNTGKTTISNANVQLKIYGPDGVLVASPSRSVRSLWAGREATVKVSYTLPLSAPVGEWKYDVYAYATIPLDQLTGRSFTVQPAVITGKIISVTDSPDPVRSGSRTTFTVKITNTGNIAWRVAQITIKIYSPDGTLATTISPKASNVKPGVEYTYKALWTAARLKGTYTYEVYLDYSTYRIDSNTGNTIQVT